MVGKKILASEGITHQVFEIQTERGGDTLQTEGDNIESQATLRTEDLPKVLPPKLNVSEVVREQKMKFFRVPRLGSYMVIKMTYDSCLNEDALDDAVRDQQEVNARVKAQDDERKEFEDEQERQKEEKEKIEEEFVPKDREWEDIKTKDFIVEEKTFTIGLDTLGKAKDFTPEQ